MRTQDPKDSSPNGPEIIFQRVGSLLPRVIQKDTGPYLQVAGGANANHELRTFIVPVSEAHVEVITHDIKRHFLLWAALAYLCDQAGTQGEIDEAALMLLDPILFGTETEVEDFLSHTPWSIYHLIAAHADIKLLESGQLFAALDSARLDTDWGLVDIYIAARSRTRRGVTLAPIDEALLVYTGRLTHGGALPTRNPDKVDPALLPQVLEIVATAERACAGQEMARGWGPAIDAGEKKRAWHTMKSTTESALRMTYPELTNDAIETVSFLVCQEASR